MRYRRALPVEALQRRMDAREPDARYAQDRAAQRARKEERKRTHGGQRRARRDGTSGDRADEPPRRIAAAGDGWRELCRVGERLVAVAKKPRESEAARHDGKRDNGLAVSNGRLGSAGGQRRQTPVEGESRLAGAGAWPRTGNRDPLGHAALHDVPLNNEPKRSNENYGTHGRNIFGAQCLAGLRNSNRPSASGTGP